MNIGEILMTHDQAIEYFDSTTFVNTNSMHKKLTYEELRQIKEDFNEIFSDYGITPKPTKVKVVFEVSMGEFQEPEVDYIFEIYSGDIKIEFERYGCFEEDMSQMVLDYNQFSFGGELGEREIILD
jgi:hypothetical protein